VAERSLVSERTLVHRVRVLLVLGGIAAVLASMMAGWLLAGRASRPVKRAYEAQASFAADASHELRTPLAFIRSGVEVLAEDDPPRSSSRRAELGGEVLSEIDNLSGLAERLLLLARADRGGLRLSTQPVDLGDVCRSSVKRASVARGLRIDVRSVNGVRAVADPVATGAVIDVLLENVAVHGGGRAELTCEVEDGRAVVSVSDHGPGLDNTDRAAAFDRFFRADPARARDTGGTGLGLAIAKSLVEAQHGSIWLEPTDGGGATVRVALPLSATED